MKKVFKSSVIAAMAMMTVPFVSKADDQEPEYLRSSLYTILVNSKTQNDRIEQENSQVADNEYMSMIKTMANTDAKKAANDTSTIALSLLPQREFMSIAIPAQFNDHNLAIREIDFDTMREGVSQADADQANEAATGKKKSKFGAFAKAAGSMALSAASNSESSLINTDDTGDFMVAVVNKFINQDNTAAKMTARWFDYSSDAKHWDDNMTTLNERALASLNINEHNDKTLAASAKMLNLIPNTFMLAVNLSFRSNKAIVAESQKVASGLLGSGASLLGAAASAAAGDGYSVQATTVLYRLVWDENVENAVGKALENNSSLDDLIATGVCKLEVVGKDKATAHVRQSVLSDKPISALVSRATTRAIDAAIVKLQEKNEVFRSIFPISGCDADGGVRVKIGTREGVSKGDTYAILERQEDENGQISYKEVATVKPNEKQIWNNLAGAEEEAAENKSNKDGKDDAEFDNDAVSLGYTTFVGKKGKDYAGYYIQLKKKK